MQLEENRCNILALWRTFRMRQVELTRAVDTLAEGGDVVSWSPEGLVTSLPNTGGVWLPVPFDEDLVCARV